MKQFKTGLILGSFSPLLDTQSQMIEQAQKECEDLLVIVIVRNSDTIPKEIRKNWIKKKFPLTNVYSIVEKEGTETWWAETIKDFYPNQISVVYSSRDSYGEAFSKLLNSQLSKVPNLKAGKIDNSVKGFFKKRILVCGPESEKTKSLCRSLSESFDTCWLPDYFSHDGKGSVSEVLDLEDEAYNRGKHIVLMEDGILRYQVKSSLESSEYLSKMKTRYEKVFLIEPSTPTEFREFTHFKKILDSQGITYDRLTGTMDAILLQAEKIIAGL